MARRIVQHLRTSGVTAPSSADTSILAGEIAIGMDNSTPKIWFRKNNDEFAEFSNSLSSEITYSGKTLASAGTTYDTAISNIYTEVIKDEKVTAEALYDLKKNTITNVNFNGSALTKSNNSVSLDATLLTSGNTKLTTFDISQISGLVDGKLPYYKGTFNADTCTGTGVYEYVTIGRSGLDTKFDDYYSLLVMNVDGVVRQIAYGRKINDNIFTRLATPDSDGSVGGTKFERIIPYDKTINLTDSSDISEKLNIVSLSSDKDVTFYITNSNGGYPNDIENITADTTSMDVLTRSLDGTNDAVSAFKSNWQAYYQVLTSTWYSQSVDAYKKALNSKTFRAGDKIRIYAKSMTIMEYCETLVDFSSISISDNAFQEYKTLRGYGSSTDGDFIRYLINNGEIYSAYSEPNTGGTIYQLKGTDTISAFTYEVIPTYQVVSDETNADTDTTTYGVYTNISSGRNNWVNTTSDGSALSMLINGEKAQIGLDASGRLYSRRGTGIWNLTNQIMTYTGSGTPDLNAIYYPSVIGWSVCTNGPVENHHLTVYTIASSDYDGNGFRSCLQIAIDRETSIPYFRTIFRNIPGKEGQSTFLSTEWQGGYATATDLAKVESIAKGANQSLVFDSYSAMVTALNTQTSVTYNVGQNIYIKTLEVPDLFVSGTASTQVTPSYTYSNDDDVVTKTGSENGLSISYYTLNQLETQKVDLTPYLESSDTSYVKTINVNGVDKTASNNKISISATSVYSGSTLLDAINTTAITAGLQASLDYYKENQVFTLNGIQIAAVNGIIVEDTDAYLRGVGLMSGSTRNDIGMEYLDKTSFYMAQAGANSVGASLIYKTILDDSKYENVQVSNNGIHLTHQVTSTGNNIGIAINNSGISVGTDTTLFKYNDVEVATVDDIPSVPISSVTQNGTKLMSTNGDVKFSSTTVYSGSTLLTSVNTTAITAGYAKTSELPSVPLTNVSVNGNTATITNKTAQISATTVYSGTSLLDSINTTAITAGYAKTSDLAPYALTANTTNVKSGSTHLDTLDITNYPLKTDIKYPSVPISSITQNGTKLIPDANGDVKFTSTTVYSGTTLLTSVNTTAITNGYAKTSDITLTGIKVNGTVITPVSKVADIPMTTDKTLVSKDITYSGETISNSGDTVTSALTNLFTEMIDNEQLVAESLADLNDNLGTKVTSGGTKLDTFEVSAITFDVPIETISVNGTKVEPVDKNVNIETATDTDSVKVSSDITYSGTTISYKGDSTTDALTNILTELIKDEEVTSNALTELNDNLGTKVTSGGTELETFDLSAITVDLPFNNILVNGSAVRVDTNKNALIALTQVYSGGTLQTSINTEDIINSIIQNTDNVKVASNITYSGVTISNKGDSVTSALTNILTELIKDEYVTAQGLEALTSDKQDKLQYISESTGNVVVSSDLYVNGNKVITEGSTISTTTIDCGEY